jgi:hypothetical protein
MSTVGSLRFLGLPLPHPRYLLPIYGCPAFTPPGMATPRAWCISFFPPSDILTRIRDPSPVYVQASTMNALAEALGMSLPGCASIPAPYRERAQMSYRTGKCAMPHTSLGMILKRAPPRSCIGACPLFVYGRPSERRCPTIMGSGCCPHTNHIAILYS